MFPLSKDEVDRVIDNNLVDEFDRLAATPGFVLTPMPFSKGRMIAPVLHRAFFSYLRNNSSLPKVQELANEGTLKSLVQLGRHRTYRGFRAKSCKFFPQLYTAHLR